MKINQIDDAVFEGIRKTISRFRRKPFHYFTEADIHSSLLNDITRAAPDLTIIRPNILDDNLGHLNHISVSLVHQEYPTHYRYKKDLLLKGYATLDEVEKTAVDYKDENGKTYGDRGNFDLAVINKDFAINMLLNRGLADALKEIIHKDNGLAIERLKDTSDNFRQELLYAIEVKFIHAFNARNIGMLHEVIKDDNKLRLASINSGGFIKPINLVFCSYESHQARGRIESVIDLIKDYIRKGETIDRRGDTYKHPEEVASIFVESFITEDIDKQTNKPIGIFPKSNWGNKLAEELNIK